MAIEARTLSVGGMSVDLVRKSIKNLHLAVYPPDGRVRVAAPWHVSDDAIRLAIATRVAWISRQRRRFLAQDRQSNPNYMLAPKRTKAPILRPRRFVKQLILLILLGCGGRI